MERFVCVKYESYVKRILLSEEEEKKEIKDADNKFSKNKKNRWINKKTSQIKKKRYIKKSQRMMENLPCEREDTKLKSEENLNKRYNTK